MVLSRVNVRSMTSLPHRSKRLSTASQPSALTLTPEPEEPQLE